MCLGLSLGTALVCSGGSFGTRWPPVSLILAPRGHLVTPVLSPAPCYLLRSLPSDVSLKGSASLGLTLDNTSDIIGVLGWLFSRAQEVQGTSGEFERV